jgi:hypothetical protein
MVIMFNFFMFKFFRVLMCTCLIHVVVQVHVTAHHQIHHML